jgi:putative heme-binding domain-containing protein
MPLIGARLADPDGTALIRDWIRSMGGATNDGMRSLRAGDAARMLASSSGALELLDCAGKTGIASNSEVAEAIANHTNAFIRDLCQRLLPPDRRRVVLGTDAKAENILQQEGNAARGRELFSGAAQCSRCHVYEGQGRAFGPELTGLGRRYSRAQILEQILNPSKQIAPEYRTTSLVLAGGEEWTGFVVNRTATEITLRDETLALRTVPLATVKESRESTLSAMPEGLLAPLTAQEAADLLEALARTNAPSR